MLYDWKKINDEYISKEFKPFRSISPCYPTFELFNLDDTDFNHMQHMISCNIIIPITFEEEYGKDTNRLIEY